MSPQLPDPASPPQRRESPRVRVEAEVEVVFGDTAVRGTLHDIGRGGVFVALPSRPAVQVDSVLRMRFVLPNGAELSACGRVRWLSGAQQPGAAGCGVEFYGLGAAELAAISELVEQPGQAAAESPGIKVLGKYTVESRPEQGRIWISINGFLDPDESRELETAVGEHLARTSRAVLMVYIDATRFQPSPDSSLDSFRRCLRLMAQGRSLMGVLVGANSVGMLQMRRLAREAGVADVLVCFATHEEATSFWDELALG